MNQPRLFISAVSEELRTARKAVSDVVRSLGYEPVSQDDYLAGHGELRQWLRGQIESCEGLLQIVGLGYGKEPPDVDRDYGRVSYTQFEFFYARLRGKTTWVINAGEHCQRDKEPEHLDLPRDANHLDPAGYQAERRALQQRYVARLTKENHLRHTADNLDKLENIVHCLKDELGQLRQKWEEWLQSDAEFKKNAAAGIQELATTIKRRFGRSTSATVRAAFSRGQIRGQMCLLVVLLVSVGLYLLSDVLPQYYANRSELALMLHKPCWVGYDPLDFDPRLGVQPSAKSVARDLDWISKAGFNGIVTFSSQGQLVHIPRLAKDRGFTVIMGVWNPRDTDEIDRAAQAAAFVDAYCVGHNGLDSRYTLEELKSAISPQPSISPGLFCSPR